MALGASGTQKEVGDAMRLIAALVAFGLASGAGAQQTRVPTIVPMAGSNWLALVDGQIVEYDPDQSEFPDYGPTQSVEVIDLWQGEKPRVVVGAVTPWRTPAVSTPPAAPKPHRHGWRSRPGWGFSNVYYLQKNPDVSHRAKRHKHGRHKAEALRGWRVPGHQAYQRAR